MLVQSEPLSDCWVPSPGCVGLFLSGSQRTQELLVVLFSAWRTNEEAARMVVCSAVTPREGRPTESPMGIVCVYKNCTPQKKLSMVIILEKNHCLGVMSK